MSPTLLITSGFCADRRVETHDASNGMGSKEEIVAMNGLATQPSDMKNRNCRPAPLMKRPV